MFGWVIICAALLSTGASVGIKGVYNGYQLLEVIPTTNEQVQHVHNLAKSNAMLDFWSEAPRVGSKATIFIPPEEVASTKSYLEGGSLAINVISENYGPEVDARLETIEREKKELKATAYDYNIYHPYDEIMAEVDDMVNRCPIGFQCEVYSIGTSYEGRDQKMLRIYKNEPGRSVYWIDSLIHAREWLSGAVHQNIVNHMLANYESDSDVRSLLDKGDWHFLFVHNPDGYSYTWSDMRLWRKNRFNNTLTDPTTNCMGIDLNRNYMHRWKNSGTSDLPCSNTYPGTSPSSEIEVKNVQGEILRLRSRIKAFVTLHTYGRMILTPWGSVLDPGVNPEICEFLPEPHKSNVQLVAETMAKAIEDTHGYNEWLGGTFCDILYPSGGTTQDFVTSVSGMIYSFTPELRGTDAEGNQYGFEAPPEEIQPAFEEVWNGLVAMVNAIDDLQTSGQARHQWNPLAIILMCFILAVLF